jgi:hypothetical protein
VVAATPGTPAIASCRWAGRRRGCHEEDPRCLGTIGGGRRHQPPCTVRAAPPARVRPGTTSRRPRVAQPVIVVLLALDWKSGGWRAARWPVQRATPRCDGRSVWRMREATAGGGGILSCGASDGGAHILTSPVLRATAGSSWCRERRPSARSPSIQL